MISIESIKFDTSAWQKLEEAHDHIVWQNDADCAFITMHYFSVAPDIPCALDEIDVLRHSYRQGVSSAGGGLISLDVFELQKLDTVEIICKIPQEPSGMSYIASLTFPFSQFSYVVKIDTEELGMTGLRDSLVMAECMKAGQIEIDSEANAIKGWAADPYDPSWNGPSLRNKSEDEKYDDNFPQHPLSRARRVLRSIKQSLTCSPDLHAAKKFSG